MTLKKSTTAFLFFCATTALAENADSLRTVDLQEVSIVSSIKENGMMRQQPVSVSLIGQKLLNANQVVSLKGTSNLVPNLFIPDYGSRLTSAIYIRGIGSRINTPAVGLYVDNIPYVDKSAFDFNFCDIERVDVMRGPQGTLYGRNTMGGLMRVYTKNPLFYEGTDVSLGYATGDNHRRASITHYHHVSDRFAFSVGGYYEGSNGFFTNDLTGKKADKSNAGGGKLRAILKANDRLSFDLTTNYDYTDEGAYPYYYTGSLTPDEEYADAIGKMTNNRENRYRRGMFNAGMNAEYQGDGWQMNAVTAYQKINDRMFLDQDFLAKDIYTLEQKQRINTLSEEITFRTSGSDVWKSVSGANIMYQTLHTDGPVNFMEDGVSSLIEGNINSVFARLKEQNPKMPTMGIAMQKRQFEVTSNMDTPTLSAAVFHQSTVSLGDFDFTLGARLEYNDRKLEHLSGTDLKYDFSIAMSPAMKIPYNDLVASPQRTGELKDHDVQLLPKFAVQYNLPEELGNIYASVSKGYRSGGYNIQMFSDIIQGDMRSDMMVGINDVSKGMMERFVDMESMTAKQDVDIVTYKPEYSWNYELGTHLTLADHRFVFDAAVFYNRIYDQQIARFAPSGFGRMMVNAGKSESYGGELSLRWTPTRNLAIIGNYGYTHSTFLDYEDGKGNDYAGKYVPFVPKHNMNIDASYTWFLDNKDSNGGWWDIRSISVGANCTSAGRIFWTESNDVSQSFYSLFGARATAETPHLSLSLWCKNITNRKYNTFYFESASHGFEQHGKPFQMGIDLSLKF